MEKTTLDSLKNVENKQKEILLQQSLKQLKQLAKHSLRYHPIRSYGTIMTDLMCRIGVMEDSITLQKEKDIRQKVGKGFGLGIFLGIVLGFIGASVVFLFVLK